MSKQPKLARWPLGAAIAVAVVGGGAILSGLFLRSGAAVSSDASEPGNCRANWPASALSDAAPKGMVWVPAGSVTIGSTQYYAEEGPPTAITVKGFWIDRFEVTNAEFSEFVTATGYVTSAEHAHESGFPEDGSAVFEANPKSGNGWSFVAGANWRHPDGPHSSIAGRDDDPVVQVSLDDAKAYAAWKGRALPTEEEWEYAARGGVSGREFAWGDALAPNGKYMANTWQGQFPYQNDGSDGHMGRAPVGCYQPNEFGAYDMIGNVWEWTRSIYYPNHKPTNVMLEFTTGFDPRQPGVPVGVIKGGSYLCAPNYCRRYRPAARYAQETGFGTNHIGFRTILEAPGPAH